MKFSRILCTTALLGLALGLSAAVAHADGGDPKLRAGGGTGSPPCFQDGGFSFQGTTDANGNITQSCDNNSSSDVTTFSFDILSAYAGTGITPVLDGLLSPFTGVLSALDWTASCTSVTAGPITTCTASQSTVVANFESQLCAGFLGAVCAQAATVTDAELIAEKLPVFAQYGNNPCADPYVYVFLGVIPGCDISFSTIPGQGSFTPNVTYDIAPAGSIPANLPEPASFSLLLVGLGSLPLLRRKFARS